MPPILSIETATSVCSVAIHNNGCLIASSEFHLDKIHATVLTPAIEFLLQQSGMQWNELTAIAVSKGPGSYTGLRIGVAVAKGLSFTLNIPLIGVETLEAIALSVASFAKKDSSRIFSMIDARRMEVYGALFDATGVRLMPTQAVVIDEVFLQSLIESYPIIFCGNGADKCRAMIQTFQNAFIMDGVYPLAKWIGEIATTKLAQKQFENLVDFEPFYLKEFVRISK